ncbi:hypothetical protein SUGI_1029000 [Cryptomeria japonica]|nr:hypothetical protein SUGI_1029000 [Cryptomeria japonica]
MRSGNGGAMFVKVAVVLLCLANLCNGEDHIVGDSNGWDFNVDYQSWASKHTFREGDNLVFKYNSMHTVVKVNSSNYETCNPDLPLSEDDNGNTIVSLNSVGEHYFICGIGSHCRAAKMKLKVTVTGTSISPSMDPAGVPATPSSTSPLHNKDFYVFVSVLSFVCSFIFF